MSRGIGRHSDASRSAPLIAARPTRSLKKWKADLAAAVSKQKGRQFEPSDAAKLYGMF